MGVIVQRNESITVMWGTRWQAGTGAAAERTHLDPQTGSREN